MALPADFNKIFGSTATGGLTPIGDVNYAKGWEFVGSNPPTKNDFSYLQNLSDLKAQYLYKVIGGDSGAPAIGIPFFWPSSAMPNTVMPEWSDMVFLKFNGATFSAATYPKLALVFPGLALTEARGEFLRIWDDGRGVDADRGLLSAQGHTYQSHSHRLLMSAGSAGTGNVIGVDGGLNGTLTYNVTQPGGGLLQAIENAGSTETRPRNIAFNFLVRAK